MASWKSCTGCIRRSSRLTSPVSGAHAVSISATAAKHLPAGCSPHAQPKLGDKQCLRMLSRRRKRRRKKQPRRGNMTSVKIELSEIPEGA